MNPVSFSLHSLSLSGGVHTVAHIRVRVRVCDAWGIVILFLFFCQKKALQSPPHATSSSSSLHCCFVVALLQRNVYLTKQLSQKKVPRTHLRNPHTQTTGSLSLSLPIFFSLYTHSLILLSHNRFYIQDDDRPRLRRIHFSSQLHDSRPFQVFLSLSLCALSLSSQFWPHPIEVVFAHYACRFCFVLSRHYIIFSLMSVACVSMRAFFQYSNI